MKLKFTDLITNKELTPNCSDLIAICKIENDSLCKLTKLNHATLYPTNYEKLKVTLMLNIFNEKTFLDLKDWKNTAIFVKAVTFLWNLFKLSGKNRKTFESVDDQILESILLLAEKFKI